jgi:2-iminobutanoate/2-iminopropanoate deaminase
MEIKESRGLAMPWEEEYGYAQALKIGRSVWISGQLGTNESGSLAEGMEEQMRLTYQNIENLLKTFDMTMDTVVDETIYVTDMESGFQARKKLGRIVYTDVMSVPSTIVAIKGLALGGQLVEIKVEARGKKKKKAAKDKTKAEFE